MICQLEKQPGRGPSIVGADKAGIAEVIRRVVVTGNDDDPVLGPGIFRDDVADRKLPFGRVSREEVVLHVVALQMGINVIFEFLVIGAADGPRSKRCDLLGVLESSIGVDARQRTGVRRSRHRRLRL